MIALLRSALLFERDEAYSSRSFWTRTCPNPQLSGGQALQFAPRNSARAGVPLSRASKNAPAKAYLRLTQTSRSLSPGIFLMSLKCDRTCLISSHARTFAHYLVVRATSQNGNTKMRRQGHCEVCVRSWDAFAGAVLDARESGTPALVEARGLSRSARGNKISQQHTSRSSALLIAFALPNFSRSIASRNQHVSACMSGFLARIACQTKREVSQSTLITCIA